MHPTLALGMMISLGLESVVCPPDPAAWVEVTVPKRDTDAYEQFRRATYESHHAWTVSIDAKNGNRVVVRPAERDYFSGPKPAFTLEVAEVPHTYRGIAKCAVRVEDGWLVAFNAGEWGGAVWWFSEDGKKRYEVGEYCQVNQFISTKDGLFAVEGLSHLTLSHGSVVRFDRKDSKWQTKELAKLPAAGCAVADRGDGSLLVVTGPQLTVTKDRQVVYSTKLVRVTKEGKQETILDTTEDLPYPTSLAIAPSGKVYVGMRHFVAVFDPKDKQPGFKLLVPRKEFLPPSK